VFWTGEINTGSEVKKVEDGVYVIVLTPTNEAMSQFPSYLPVKIAGGPIIEEP
jgi:hypothetical protein